MQLVNHLFERGEIDAAGRLHLERQADAWGVPAHSLLRTFGLIAPDIYLARYESAYRFRRVPPVDLQFCAPLSDLAPWETWRRALALPVLLRDGSQAIAAVDPVNLPPELRELGVTATLILEEEWVELAGAFFGGRFLDEAVNGLAREHPELSARRTFTNPQLGILWASGTALLACMWLDARLTLIALNCVLNVFFALCVGFKTLLAFIGSTRNVSQKVTPMEIERLDERALPIYTILVPVYKEPSVVANLIRQLANLNYPLCKLDVKVLLESGDEETINAFRTANPPPNFHAIIVPDSQPKTKPKACNYGLFFANGDYLAIYDAEDFPEPDQLEKVVIAFRKLPAHVVCIQGCLNYFNWSDNLLTRMFTLEYSSWFDYNLPGMEALKVPIPLGGTSNHFKIERLRELGAWDPYNVTEDADLGLRASARGYTVATIDSTTYEEANCAYGNWIRQRSRWIKGYMQTFLVHMRNPVKLMRTLGPRGFLGFTLFIGGTPLVFLLNPILWAVLLLWLFTRATVIAEIFPAWLFYLSFVNLAVGNLMAIYTCVLAVFRRGNYSLGIYSLLNPLYWIMHSIASYKGLWQLIVRPFYWEKTTHGLSALPVSFPAASKSGA
jgi:cellulose synthase/poly-beta-1,6-N-acetylglucosamine synthase-like glycosyltransferase